jgi:hypothetical protein
MNNAGKGFFVELAAYVLQFTTIQILLKDKLRSHRFYDGLPMSKRKDPLADDHFTLDIGQFFNARVRKRTHSVEESRRLSIIICSKKLGYALLMRKG